MRVQENPPSESGEPVADRLFDGTAAVLSAESRGETVDQVLDRNVAELLQELRVAFTGVQILFAFLLSLAFTQRFRELDGFDLAVYVTALMCTAVTTMVLMAPVSFHRLIFRRRQKAALVVVADRLLIIGLALLVPAISSSVLLILDVALGPPGDGRVAWGLINPLCREAFRVPGSPKTNPRGRIRYSNLHETRRLSRVRQQSFDLRQTETG